MSSSKNLEYEKTAFLNKSNSAFIEEMHLKFVNNDPTLPLSWKKYFEKYQVHYFVRGQSGVDIEYLKNDNNVLLGLRPDSQRYFDYHHSSSDIFETVNKRELELGTAAIASIVFLSDYFQL